jgi:hypothetical protein
MGLDELNHARTGEGPRERETKFMENFSGSTIFSLKWKLGRKEEAYFLSLMGSPGLRESNNNRGEERRRGEDGLSLSSLHAIPDSPAEKRAGS